MSQTYVIPYLFFGGRCEEALDFYKSAVGAQVDMMMKFGDSPEPPPPDAVPPGFDDKIMHTSFRIGNTVVMASDGCESGSAFGGFALSIVPTDKEDANRMFNALADGGTVTMPLGETFFSPCFGMLKDRFGMEWMIAMQPENQAPQS